MFIHILKKTKMFSGVDEEEIKLMLDCLSAKTRAYKKGEYVFRQGENIEIRRAHV